MQYKVRTENFFAFYVVNIHSRFFFAPLREIGVIRVLFSSVQAGHGLRFRPGTWFTLLFT